MSSTYELLTGLTVDELEALADSLLAPTAQARLVDLLARRIEKPLSAVEENELDRILQKADQPTILKTGARNTLSQSKAEATGTGLPTFQSNSRGEFANASRSVAPFAERPKT